MATINSINSEKPIEVSKGGTGLATTTAAYTVLCGGTTTTGPLQNVASVGTTAHVLTSNGAAALPTFQAKTVNVIFTPVATDQVDPLNGEVWYNTTDDAYRAYSDGASVWVAKTGLNTARRLLGGTGTSGGDSFAFGGFTPSVYLSSTERYDGGPNTWTNKGSLNNTISENGSAGSADDALSFGGYTTVIKVITERYSSGTNTWTVKTSMNTGTHSMGSSGTATDALSIGGLISGGFHIAATEQYEGVGDTWTAKNPLNTGRSHMASCGTVSDSLVTCGVIAGSVYISSTERYNGTIWTTKASTGTNKAFLGGCGIANFALIFAGQIFGTLTAVTQKYSGDSDAWSSMPDVNTARKFLGSGGTATDALSFGGYTTVTLGTTERFEGSYSSFTVS